MVICLVSCHLLKKEKNQADIGNESNVSIICDQ